MKVVTLQGVRRRRRARCALAFSACFLAGLWTLACGTEPPSGEASNDPALISQVAASPEAVSTDASPGSPVLTQVRRALVQPQGIPASMQTCRGCHKDVVDTYLTDHAMAASVGPMDGRMAPPPGVVERPLGDRRYEITEDAMLIAHGDDGGQRKQRIVGWIGAGVFDVSWVSEELDVVTGEPTGRLFFAPVETLREHGNELSPFDLTEHGAGLDMGLTQGCVTCHTLTPLPDLSESAVLAGSQSLDHVFPDNHLGSQAMAEMQPLGCETCHGDASEHLEVVTAGYDDFVSYEDGEDDDWGIVSLGRETAAVQRDVCGRCHLQGDARMDIVQARVDASKPLAAQIPVLVPTRQDDDFRFVGQLERLVQSACFLESQDMTCSTCHDPHRGVAAQGLESFEAACMACHGGGASVDAAPTANAIGCSRAPDLTVEAASGRVARDGEGCVDCHVRRSQPFDLPHVASVDHWIRRRIPAPQDDIPHRQFAHQDADLEIYDDGRLAPLFETPGGRRWKDGVEAIGLLTLGRLEEALDRFESFPPPGSTAARTPSAPSPLVPLETQVMFHQSRGLTLMGKGRFDEALAAFNDALAIDPESAPVLLARAQLRFDLGQVGPALQDTQTVIDLYPKAEQPWDLRAHMAERLGRVDLVQAAFEASDKRWPSNATQLYKLGLLLRQVGRHDAAQDALQTAYLLDPDLEIGGAGKLADQLGSR